jgi:hypothetical protein
VNESGREMAGVIKSVAEAVKLDEVQENCPSVNSIQFFSLMSVLILLPSVGPVFPRFQDKSCHFR